MKTIFLFLLLPCLALAQPQQSADFRITKSVLDGGGVSSASADFRLTSACGQATPIGLQASADFRLSAGFLTPAFGVSTASPILQLVISYAAPDVHLNWEPIPGTVSYVVYRGTTVDFALEAGAEIGTTTDTSFIDLNAFSLPLAKYFYSVAASSEAAPLLTRHVPANELSKTPSFVKGAIEKRAATKTGIRKTPKK